MRKRVLLASITLILSSFGGAYGQDPTPTPATATDEQKQKDKEAAEKRALALLDQVLDQVQMLRLPENRIRVQLAGADMLWDRNQQRARSLLAQAADGVAEMM